LSFSLHPDTLDREGGISMVKENCTKCQWGSNGVSCGSNGAVYGLGMLGAAVYFLQQATGVWEGVIGILKALVWPAFLVYEALRFLGI